MQWRADRLNLPGIGVEWNSEQNDYYYGVSRKESSRGDLRGAITNDSWNPYLELSANYNFAVTGHYMVLRATPSVG